MNASEALAQLDNFPAFKRELVELLEMGTLYAKHGILAHEGEELINQVLRLGSMIQLSRVNEKDVG